MQMPRYEDPDPFRLNPDERQRIERCEQLLRERFPHVKSISLDLLERNDAFRELCQEYVACTEVMERLTHRESNEALRKEYSALQLRVEGELLRFISEHGCGSEGG